MNSHQIGEMILSGAFWALIGFTGGGIGALAAMKAADYRLKRRMHRAEPMNWTV